MKNSHVLSGNTTSLPFFLDDFLLMSSPLGNSSAKNRKKIAYTGAGTEKWVRFKSYKKRLIFFANHTAHAVLILSRFSRRSTSALPQRRLDKTIHYGGAEHHGPTTVMASNSRFLHCGVAPLLHYPPFATGRASDLLCWQEGHPLCYGECSNDLTSTLHELR